MSEATVQYDAGDEAVETYRARSAFLYRLWNDALNEQDRENLSYAICLIGRAQEGEVFGDPSLHSTVDSSRVIW